MPENPNVIAVLLLFLFYLMNVLVPLIPAVLIYRMFPDTKVAVSGPLQGLTVKATGAFAAYVITLLIGYGIVKNTPELIGGMVATTWKVHATIKLYDHDNKPLAGSGSLESMHVEFRPRLHSPGDDRIHVTIPLEKADSWPSIVFTMAGFENRALDLQEKIAEGKVVRNNRTREITVKDPIILNRASDNAVAAPYRPTGLPLQPGAAGPSGAPAKN